MSTEWDNNSSFKHILDNELLNSSLELLGKLFQVWQIRQVSKFHNYNALVKATSTSSGKMLNFRD